MKSLEGRISSNFEGAFLRSFNAASGAGSVKSEKLALFASTVLSKSLDKA
jgi:hypothetical protein